MNMNIRLLVSLIFCISSPVLFGMQKQEQVQLQEQKQQEDSSEAKPLEKTTQEESLESQLASILNTVTQANGSIDSLIKSKLRRRKVILCSICGRQECAFSREVDEDPTYL